MMDFGICNQALDLDNLLQNLQEGFADKNMRRRANGAMKWCIE
ncbi:MAG: hypothetical protein ACR5LD_08220 [Symbiopectobacterium sp.]